MQRFLNWDFFSSFTKRNCFSLFFWTHEVGHLSCLKVSPLPWWPPPSFPDEKSCFLTHHYSRAVLLLASRTERSRSQAWIDRHACHSINPRIDILVKEDVIFGAFACQWPWENIYFVQTHWEPSDNETPELLSAANMVKCVFDPITEVPFFSPILMRRKCVLLTSELPCERWMRKVASFLFLILPRRKSSCWQIPIIRNSGRVSTPTKLKSSSSLSLPT